MIYSMCLPVAKKDIVKARILFVVILEMLQMVLLIPFAVLRQNILAAGNEAGIDANITLFAEGFLLFGVFNLIFFHSYYRNVDKVGISFVKASVVFFVLVVVDVIVTHGVPFVRDCLDTPDPQFMGYKLVALAIGIMLYVVMTVQACRISVRNFEVQDL